MFILAGLFLFIYSITLTLSQAARARTWQVNYRWDHWIGFGLWAVMFALVHFQSAKLLPERDPYLLPLAALLSGWGLLTIWRLFPAFGIRQSLWLFFSVAVLVLALRLPGNLGFLRRYKYLWLTGGLLLTALTLFLGTNPSGGSLPHLWLGCCGIYIMPSEPLKLLLIIYLSAYLADQLLASGPLNSGLLPLLGPTIIMTGVALLLLVAQQDLGTATIFLFLYAVTVYIASGQKRILLLGGLAVLLAAAAGYTLFGVVRIRIDAWLDPWLDPSGHSYQIVQSLLAIANGGLFGRGPGLGNPGLVPVPQSDFIFAAIVEENGLVGAFGMLILLGLLASRGVIAALRAPDTYRRYLAAGLTAHLVGQSILIIGGNLRLLPLTGVTLPLVSYGGSSLLTSFLSLVLLIHIGARAGERPAPLVGVRSYFQLETFLLSGLGAAAVLAGWWSIYRSPDLLNRTDNPRRAIVDRSVKRGSLVDRHNTPIQVSEGSPGNFIRRSLYPELGPVIGYTHPIYGQSGLEASLDPYLRGVQGNPALSVWWNHLLYGQPPAGLDVRLTLDLGIQRAADAALGDHPGALVLLDARSGDILAMASHPFFNPDTLDSTWSKLIVDPQTPLLNRAAQGQYQPGTSLGPLLLAEGSYLGNIPSLPQMLSYRLGSLDLSCALTPPQITWGSVISSGCPAPIAALAGPLNQPGDQRQTNLQAFFRDLGFYEPPAIRLPVDSSSLPANAEDPVALSLGQADLRPSPLQMALATAVMSADGTRPAPRLVLAVKTPQSGWVILPDLSASVRVFPPGVTESLTKSMAVEGQPFWQSVAIAFNGPDKYLTWYNGGTFPNWKGTSLAITLLLEENNPELAVKIGQQVLQSALQP
ncbi:MAG: FtsW/RodA/SpoVE family cell cycle protein [Omnitrophica WOR_2 bacterium]